MRHALVGWLVIWLMTGCGMAPLGPLSSARSGAYAAEASRGSLHDVVKPTPSIDYAHSARGAVLLVHGHDGSSNDWSFWSPRLRELGWAPKAFTFGTDTWDIPQLAAQVALQVEALCHESNQDQIDVVAHSIGGLATRYYIKNLGGDKRIRHLVMLGTPNHGIYATAVMPELDIRAFMVRNNDFLNQLNKPAETFGPVIYTCIWSTGDYTQLVPFASCRLKGAFLFRTGGVSHSGMLFEAKLQQAIEAGLNRRPDEQPGPEQTI